MASALAVTTQRWLMQAAGLLFAAAAAVVQGVEGEGADAEDDASSSSGSSVLEVSTYALCGAFVAMFVANASFALCGFGGGILLQVLWHMCAVTVGVCSGSIVFGVVAYTLSGMVVMTLQAFLLRRAVDQKLTLHLSWPMCIGIVGGVALLFQVGDRVWLKRALGWFFILIALQKFWVEFKEAFTMRSWQTRTPAHNITATSDTATVESRGEQGQEESKRRGPAHSRASTHYNPVSDAKGSDDGGDDSNDEDNDGEETKSALSAHHSRRFDVVEPTSFAGGRARNASTGSSSENNTHRVDLEAGTTEVSASSSPVTNEDDTAKPAYSEETMAFDHANNDGAFSANHSAVINGNSNSSNSSSRSSRSTSSTSSSGGGGGGGSDGAYTLEQEVEANDMSWDAELYDKFPFRTWREYVIVISTGLASGFLAGLFATGGPPIMILTMNYPMQKDTIRATIAASFAIENFFRCLYIVFVAKAFIFQRDWLLLVIVLSAALSGQCFGNYLAAFVDAILMRRIIVCLLSLGACLMVSAETSPAVSNAAIFTGVALIACAALLIAIIEKRWRAPQCCAAILDALTERFLPPRYRLLQDDSDVTTDHADADVAIELGTLDPPRGQ